MVGYQLIFVLGCQRSGTTLLGQLIGSQPGAVLIDEKDDAYPLTEALLNETDDFEERLSTSLDAARKKYIDPNNASNAENIRFLVLKVPNATFDVERFKGNPTAPFRFIFAVRNVYDVVCSMQSLTHIPMLENQIRLISKYPDFLARVKKDFSLITSTDTPDHVRRALVWKIKTSLYQEYCAAPLNALLVRYEDLVQDRYTWAPKILKHCQIPIHTGGITPHTHVMHGLGPGGTDRTRAIDTQSMNRWAGHLDKEKRADILAVVGPLMNELYPFSDDAVVDDQ